MSRGTTRWGRALGIVASCVFLGVPAATDGGADAQPGRLSPARVPLLRRPARTSGEYPPAVAPAANVVDTTPPRAPVGLVLQRSGWTYNCMECHTVLIGRWHYDRPNLDHRNIALEHGNNRYCLNCHHPTNRNAYVDYDGATIAQGNVVDLCAKCHGTIYRDWEVGVHGRRNGYWNAAQGATRSLRCTECHDPHRPKFPAMRPLAPLRYPLRAAYPPSANRTPFPSPPGSS